MERRPTDLQHWWPNIVNKAGEDQPSAWQTWDSVEQNRLHNTYGQSSRGNDFDDLLEQGDGVMPQAQPSEEEQGAMGKNDGLQNSWHIASSPTFNDKEDDNALQNNFQPTSSAAYSYMENGYGNAVVNVGNHRHDNHETLPEIEPSINLLSEPQRDPQLHQNITISIDGRGLGEEMQHTTHRKIDKSSPMMSSLLNTPAWAYDDHSARSTSGPKLQSPFQQRNQTVASRQEPTVAREPTPTSQQQISQAEMGQVVGGGGFRTPASEFASPSEISRQSHIFQGPLTPTLVPHPNYTGSWNGSHQPQGQSDLALTTGPNSMTQHNSALPSQPDLNQRRDLNDPLTANEHIANARDEEALSLRTDSWREIYLHVRILTSYFTHALKHALQDVSTAKLLAVQHWTESAKEWESAVPETFKARLPPPPNHANAIQDMLFRLISIQAEIESDRRQNLGMRWQQSWEEWQTDINVAALKEQLKVMKLWTGMFQGMLQDLRFKFPLFEDTLQEFWRTENWSHLDPPRR